MYRIPVLSIFILLSVLSDSRAQGKISADRFIIRTSSTVYGKTNSDTQGSPYLDDNFVDAQILGSGGKYTGLLMRYNAFDDNMEFQQNGNILILDADSRINKVIIGNAVFVPGQYQYQWKECKGYLELLDSGKMTLLAKKVITFKEREAPTPMQYQGKPARFARLNDVYLYKSADGKITEIDNIKKLIEALPEKQEEAKAFAKKEKISTKRDELIEFFKYYNSIF